MYSAFTTWIHRTSIFNILTLLFCAGFLLYLNTFFNGLFFDDEHFIYNNNAVTTFSIPDIFSNSLTSGAGRLSNYYRPLLFTGFAFEYSLFGSSGFIYHLNSTLLHLFCGLLLYFILQRLFKNSFVSFLTALLFIIHPIQTEAITYASGRGDPQSLFFSLIAIYFSLRRTRISFFIAAVSLICALLSKELSLITPGLIFLCLFFEQPTFTRKYFLQILKYSLPFFLISFTYFGLRLTILNFSNTLNFYSYESVYTKSIFVRLITFFHLFPTYLSLLIFPKDLFMERDSTLTIQTFFTLSSLFTLFGLSCATVLAFLKRKKYPIFLFSILWISISFIPTSGIIPINGVFYEHFLYYPSIGFFLLFSYGTFLFLQKANQFLKNIVFLLLVLGLIFLSIRTVLRNTEWHNAIVFYEQTLHHAQSSRIYNHLAMAYAEKGDNKKAIATYKKAIALEDVHPETRYNLGNAYLEEQDLKNAEKEYKEALRIDPSFYFAHQKLMTIYRFQKDTQKEALLLQEIEKLVQINPTFLPLLQSLQKKD